VTAEVRAGESAVLPRKADAPYPEIERGGGVWLYAVDGRELLDGCSGGAGVACLGHSVRELADAAAEQANRVSYVYNHHFTNQPQEALAERLLEVAAPAMARARFVSGGSEANETALRLARSYHVERGDGGRWRVISPAPSYHGATLGTLGLTGDAALRFPYEHYLSPQFHLGAKAWRSDRSGEALLSELDRLLEEAGPDTVAAFVCEPVGGQALPGHSPPRRFWEGLAERRSRHGFLICLNEIMTGIGRTGSWFAYRDLPFVPDIVTAGKALGGGYAPLAATLCREHVYEAIAEGSREFELGHTWDGAPLPCAVGLATLDYVIEHDLVQRVAARGPLLRREVERATSHASLVGEVRGRGFLIGIELVDPRDGDSPLPRELDALSLVFRTAIDHGLLVAPAHAGADGNGRDHVLLAPAYTAGDDELTEMTDRVASAIADVGRAVEAMLAGSGAAG
jgi:adenosylmethionine-8-amino-7-oxononanoate aminotransferase